MTNYRTRVAIHRNDLSHKTHTYDTIASVSETMDDLLRDMQRPNYVATIAADPDRVTLIPLHSIGAVDIYAVPLDADRGPA